MPDSGQLRPVGLISAAVLTTCRADLNLLVWPKGELAQSVRRRRDRIGTRIAPPPMAGEQDVLEMDAHRPAA